MYLGKRLGKRLGRQKMLSRQKVKGMWQKEKGGGK